MINFSQVSKKFIIPTSGSSPTLFRAISRGINNRSLYKTILALDKVDFCINRGEIFGIIGPNGSGKTTLLRIIAGIYKPSSGVFKIENSSAYALHTKIVLFDELSVKENIFLFGAIMGLSNKKVHKSYDRIIDFSGLSDFANAEVRVLSLGMRGRLAFAISVETAKDILLLDEVVSSGDSKFREKCIEIIRKLKKEQKTIIFTSHDLDIVNELCDNVLLLNKGKVFGFGKAKEVTNSYLKLLEN